MSDDDGSLFRKAARGAQRLKQDRVAPFRRRRRPVPEQALRDEAQVIDSLGEPEFHPDIETGDELTYLRTGAPRSVLRKLRRGQFAIEAEFDLHGLTVAEARVAVNSLLREAQLEGFRCVRIIHGKGHGSAGRIPVLKGALNSWLRRTQTVLAFCSARPADGGTGAVYVLLDRHG